MKKYLKKGKATLLAVVPAFLIPAITLGGCGQKTECEKSIDTAMGTVISQTVYLTGKSTTTNGGTNDKITDVVLQKLNDLEQKELSWRLESAEVARINAAAGEGQTPVSPVMAGWLERCLQISEESAGAFDVSIGRLSRLWDIDTWAAAENPQDYELPEQEDIAQALATAGWQKIQLETEEGGSTTINIPEEMQLDLGAVGKGVALDEIRKTLEEHPEVSGAVISAGGSVLTYGSKPEGGAWQIAVTDPQNTSESVGVLTLDGDYCVSTSGDYERYVEVDGVRYHHILDPRTGSPARSDVAGVTIVTTDGFLSDALSTACFVLGQEEGLKLLEKYDAEGLFVDHEGSITMTEGMQQYFHLSNGGK